MQEGIAKRIDELHIKFTAFVGRFSGDPVCDQQAWLRKPIELVLDLSDGRKTVYAFDFDEIRARLSRHVNFNDRVRPNAISQLWLDEDNSARQACGRAERIESALQQERLFLRKVSGFGRAGDVHFTHTFM